MATGEEAAEMYTVRMCQDGAWLDMDETDEVIAYYNALPQRPVEDTRRKLPYAPGRRYYGSCPEEALVHYVRIELGMSTYDKRLVSTDWMPGLAKCFVVTEHRVWQHGQYQPDAAYILAIDDDGNVLCYCGRANAFDYEMGNPARLMAVDYSRSKRPFQPHSCQSTPTTI